MSKTVEEILDGFGIYSRWYGFDEALDTKGAHTSSTPTEAKEQAIEAINQLLIEAKLEAVQLVRVYLNEEMERFEPSEVFDSAALLAKISNYEQTLKGLDLGE